MTDLLAFKAGRAFRREGTNSVDPSPTKGAIILKNGDDGLLHFMWKNRSTNEVEEVSCSWRRGRGSLRYIPVYLGLDFDSARCDFRKGLSGVKW
jgi:hypothetical protein